MGRTTITDLVAVIYSAGKVFDGLQTGRLDTEEFLRTDSTTGITSMHDLALLRDLKDAAGVVIEHADTGHGRISTALLQQINAAMTRSASIRPGVLRRDNERIGVTTELGRHEPPAVSADRLDEIVAEALSDGSPRIRAAKLFLAVAKAQPFTDGNKRTGIFAANALLLRERTGLQLTVPFSEDDPSVAKKFNLTLARAYIHDENEAVIHALTSQGAVPAPRNHATP